LSEFLEISGNNITGCFELQAKPRLHMVLPIAAQLLIAPR